MIDDTQEVSDVNEAAPEQNQDVAVIDDTEEDTVDALFDGDTSEEAAKALKEVQDRYDIRDPSDPDDVGSEPVDEAPDEDTEASEDTSVDEAPVVDEGLARRAVELGIAVGDVNLFSQDQLQRVVSALEATTSRKKPVDAKVEKQEEVPAEAPRIELDEDLIAPEIIQGVRALEDMNLKLQHRLDALEQRTVDQQQVEFTQRFDQMVVEDGKDYADLLGSKPLRELSESSQEYRNREDVDVMMASIAAAREARGASPLGERELFQAACRAQFPEQTNKIIRGELKNTVKKRSKMATARPTHRETKDTRTQMQKAEATLQKLLNKKGVAVRPDDDGVSYLYG